MLLIACPYCGPRNETEFMNGGEAHVPRPTPAETVSAQAWADYLFFHDNPKGPLHERWVHTYGCRQWFHMTRDTLSHAILAVYGVDEPAPEPGA